jgi:hypothetical protein
MCSAAASATTFCVSNARLSLISDIGANKGRQATLIANGSFRAITDLRANEINFTFAFLRMLFHGELS